MKLAGILLIALAASGCVKQEQIRARSVPDLYRLCTDGRNEDMCMPAPDAVRVDTNLAAPPPANPLRFG
jgi:hypothetical protein